MKVFVATFAAILAAAAVIWVVWSHQAAAEARRVETRAIMAKAVPNAHDFAGIAQVAPDKIEPIDLDRVCAEAALIALRAEPELQYEIRNYSDDLVAVARFARERWPKEKAKVDNLDESIVRMRTVSGLAR